MVIESSWVFPLIAWWFLQGHLPTIDFTNLVQPTQSYPAILKRETRCVPTWSLPSGYVKIAMENGHWWRLFPLNMVIFPSYDVVITRGYSTFLVFPNCCGFLDELKLYLFDPDFIGLGMGEWPEPMTWTIRRCHHPISLNEAHVVEANVLPMCSETRGNHQVE